MDQYAIIIITIPSILLGCMVVCCCTCVFKTCTPDTHIDTDNLEYMEPPTTPRPVVVVD
jgi:hypothetical protein